VNLSKSTATLAFTLSVFAASASAGSVSKNLQGKPLGTNALYNETTVQYPPSITKFEVSKEELAGVEKYVLIKVTGETLVEMGGKSKVHIERVMSDAGTIYYLVRPIPASSGITIEAGPEVSKFDFQVKESALSPRQVQFILLNSGAPSAHGTNVVSVSIEHQ